MRSEAPDVTSGAESPSAPVRHSTRQRFRNRSVLREATQTLGIALVLAILIKTFLIQAYYIPSPSMANTLAIGDRIMVSLLAPGPLDISRGDIVVFKDPGGWLAEQEKPERNPVAQTAVDVLTWLGLLPQDSGEHLIKRVIGLPGDTIECCTAGGQLLVNGVAVTEPYLADQDWYARSSRPQDTFAITVPPNSLWVMGDNRANSLDSRYHTGDIFGSGSVPMYDVVGVAFLRTWPLDNLGLLRNPGSTFANVPDHP